MGLCTCLPEKCLGDELASGPEVAGMPPSVTRYFIISCGHAMATVQNTNLPAHGVTWAFTPIDFFF